ncbi:MAG: ROK family protein [Phycicoccus sp.]|nr:ROK family protein [Phycicoccus sp.]NMM35403.1 ROK family protein [Phycicoccus sp.]
MPEVTPRPVALAVDVGGTKVEAALVDADGQVLDRSRHRQPTGRDASSDQLAAAVVDVAERALAALPPGAPLLGAGIGSAGPIDDVNGTVSPVNIPAWRGFALRDLVRSVVSDQTADQTADPTVILATDGLAITLAEHWVGAGKGVDNMMGMVISTGVGGGLILGGRPMHGASGNAGHIGHIEVSAIDGEPTFGHPDLLEAVASGPHSVEWARRHGWKGTTGEELSRDYALGDEVARAAITRAGTAVGQAISSAAALLDVELVVIGGGFSQATPDLFRIIRETVASHQLEFVRKVRVLPSSLSGAGPLIGAAALVHLAH